MTSQATLSPSWTILVPTLGERAILFQRLLRGLLPQLDQFKGRARVAGWFNNGQPALPEIRQRMVEKVSTSHLSFVDDDDLVAPDFVARVMTALDESDPDYVGFQVQCYSNGSPIAIAHHTLSNKGWRNEPGRFLRDISHINPIRTSIARQVTFRRTRVGGPEDREWAAQLRRSRLLESEVMIDSIMYHYLHQTPDQAMGSRWHRPKMIRAGNSEPKIPHPHFDWMSA